MTGKMFKRIILIAKAFVQNKLNHGENNKVKIILGRYKRLSVYHIHIRKTAGTSINFAFLREIFKNEVQSNYKKLSNKYNHRIFNDEYVVVGWNKSLINSGNFSYAFSHIPYHKLLIKNENIYTFTCLRDPVKRVISHYNMLMHYKKNNINHPCMKVEGKWLGNSFIQFIEHIPKKHLQNQLYMFSENYDVNKAIREILNLDQVIFTDKLEKGLKKIELDTGYKLNVFNEKNYGNKEIIDDKDIEFLKKQIKDELTMYESVRKSIELNS